MKKIIQLVLLLLICNGAFAQDFDSKGALIVDQNYYITLEGEKVMIDESAIYLMLAYGEVKFQTEGSSFAKQVMKKEKEKNIKLLVYGKAVYLNLFDKKGINEVILFNDKYFMIKDKMAGYQTSMTIYDRATKEKMSGGWPGVLFRNPKGKVITESDKVVLKSVKKQLDKLSFLTYFPEMEDVYKFMLKNQEDGNQLDSGISYYKSSENVKDLVKQLFEL